MSVHKREQLMKKLEYHLRTTSRQLIKIDTEEEALQYLTDAFCSELHSDFVAVILKDRNKYTLRSWSGNLSAIPKSFPISIHECSPMLLVESVRHDNAESPDVCKLARILKQENVKTWFTLPLKDDGEQFGFCIVGFLSYIPLLDMKVSFEEFGKDMAVAMAVARQKEAQLKKMEGIEWISQNLSLDAPLEKHISEFTIRAGMGTNASFACIYLFNEKKNCFALQSPYYGRLELPSQIMIRDNYVLKDHFPFFETPGGQQLTVPLVIDLKTIGVIHIEDKMEGFFNEDDLAVLDMLSKHIAAILENARLYNSEKEHKQRLHFLLDYQQALVKETVEVDNFDGITSMLGNLFKGSVILFNRFMQPISSNLHKAEFDMEFLDDLPEMAREKYSRKKGDGVFVVENPDQPEQYFSFWLILGGGSLLGYLAISRLGREMDEFDRLTVDLARNICSIQFIKQKLVFDTKEQVKDGFIGKLLMEKIEDKESILQYANLFYWDLYRCHRIAVLSIVLNKEEISRINLLEQQAKKAVVWDTVKSRLADFDNSILTASHNEEYILIVPVEKEGTNPRSYWDFLYGQIRNWTNDASLACEILMGVGGTTQELEDYYTSYQQAIQTLAIVNSRFRESGLSLFDELGSYAILHHLEESSMIDLFVKRQIGPLLIYSEGKTIDLYNTLYVFLQNNGNVKSTAEELYIHRSSLLYRLEKIESLLRVDLNDAEVRFNLMMALKLYEMHWKSNRTYSGQQT